MREGDVFPKRRVVVHHSASPRDRTTAHDIASWHTDRGFDMIGYNYVIEAGGKLVVGRSMHRAGAHCKADGANFDSIGICVTGDNTKPSEAWDQDQIEALRTFVQSARVLFPGISVCGHRDVPGAKTACPGVDIVDLLSGVI